MRLVVGLGNPGKKYERTRHNVGYWVVEELASNSWRRTDRLGVLVSGPYRADRGEYLLVKPTTFMNNCGEAVFSLLDHYHLDERALWVVYDDTDLPLGKVKIQELGKRSTHNGVQSIVDNLKAGEFARFRLGIGRPDGGVSREKYVLGKFRAEEEEGVRIGVELMIRALRLALNDGMVAAMNRYNR